VYTDCVLQDDAVKRETVLVLVVKEEEHVGRRRRQWRR
jgi:hypothetical protein